MAAYGAATAATAATACTLLHHGAHIGWKTIENATKYLVLTLNVQLCSSVEWYGVIINKREDIRQIALLCWV